MNETNSQTVLSFVVEIYNQTVLSFVVEINNHTVLSYMVEINSHREVLSSIHSPTMNSVFDCRWSLLCYTVDLNWYSFLCRCENAVHFYNISVRPIPLCPTVRGLPCVRVYIWMDGCKSNKIVIFFTFVISN